MAESVPTNVHAIRGTIRQLTEGDRQREKEAKLRGSVPVRRSTAYSVRYANVDSNIAYTRAAACRRVSIRVLRDFDSFLTRALQRDTCTDYT